MCGECEQTTLAECTCDDAAGERKRMAEQFAKADLGNAARQEAAHDALLADYVKRHGAAAEVASFRLHAWLDPLLTLVGALAGLLALVAIVERLPARLLDAKSSRHRRR